jgi:hypothetical protein
MRWTVRLIIAIPLLMVRPVGVESSGLGQLVSLSNARAEHSGLALPSEGAAIEKSKSSVGEASPKCFTGWPCPQAGTHSNASFAAEVQSIFERRRA